ncbi:mitochondrial putative choline dehydrogenase [Setomelanomma holmii]|uniref:Mitochondrial putative choline dehydrogenase n=1 Tax=Setomelanomma holmii TaxID=210430 RepID=A0A9P4GY72_9PLEO|nr:mitochondrial putative choline dehydrogenase [Setomelanomma holmii]
MTSEYDYIIVGGGTAGVVIASRLKQYLPAARIALLEAGPNAVDHPLVNDVSDGNAWIAMIPEGLVVDYSTIPQEHLNGRQIPNPAGRMLSGSSGANVATWMRPSSADCDLISERAGHERFRFKNMVKYIRRLETHFNKAADMDFHGFDGPIHTVGGRHYPLRAILQQSAESLGHVYNPKATQGDTTGLADYVQCYKATSSTTATRQHSARVYDLKGVETICDAPVARILLDDTKRATGVELLSGKKLFASREFIVACGTQRTPQLLMLSGIGPPDELAKHDIPTLLDAPAVGQNLFDHSAFIQYYKLKHADKGYAKPFTGTALPEYSQGMPIDFCLLANIPPSELAPYLVADGVDGKASHPLLLEKRCHFMSVPFYYPLLAFPPLYPNMSEDNTIIAFAAIHTLPLSRGTVTLKSADPKDNPICDPRFLSTDTDRFIIRRAVRENMRIAATSPLADEIEGEVAPVGFPTLTKDSSDEDIDQRIRALVATIAHPMGTCAFGTVLDDEFRVKGVKGLRVCDASVFPEPVAIMPSCLIYALAEVCAELVARKE